METAHELEEAVSVPDGLLARSFAADLTAGDGRTIDVRVGPYGVEATVSDGGPAYREMWMPGAFADQVRGAKAGRASHVHVNFRHQQGFGDIIGHGLSLLERDDGLYGSFKILDGPDGDKALELVRADALSGVSLEAYSKKMLRSAEGIVQRIKGHLVGIALTPQGAFADAAVLAIREAELEEEEQAAIAPPDTELLERMKKLGIQLPDIYQIEDEAHPASGTPDSPAPPETAPAEHANHDPQGGDNA